MPVVPRYSERQVDPAPTPGPRLTAQADPDALGRDLARGGQAWAGAVEEVAEREYQKASEVAAIDWDRKLGEWSLKALHDPKTGALNQRGEAALGLHEPTLKSFDDLAGELERSAVGEDQRLALRKIAGRHRQNAELSLHRHVASESQALDAERTTADIGNARDLAIANLGDPNRVAQEIERQRMVLASHASRTGKPKEWLEAATSRAVSETHVGIIDRMLANGDDRTASAYFATAKGEIAGAELGRVERLLGESSTRGASQRLVDELMGQTGENGQPLSLDEGYARVRDATKDDPKLREAAEQRWSAMYGQRERARADNQDRVFEQAYRALIDPRNEMGILGVTVQQLDEMGPQHAQALRAIAAKPERPPQSDPLAVLELEHLAARDPQEFAKPATLLRYHGRLSPGKWEQMAALQREVIEKGDRSELLVGIRTRSDVVRDTLRGVFKKDSKDWSEAETADARRFEVMLDRQVIANQSLTGKKMGVDDVQKLADELLIKETVKGEKGWLGSAAAWALPWSPLNYDSTTQVERFRLPGAERMATTISHVPESFRTAAAEKLRARGTAATDEAILAYYNRELAKVAGNASP